MYLTYNEYVQQGGVLDNSAFARLEFRAGKLIDARTLNRIKSEQTVPETVKMLEFELIKKLDDTETRRAETVSSYSNDGVSVSLVKPPSEAEAAALLDGLIVEYLTGETTSGGVPLLYLGVC